MSEYASDVRLGERYVDRQTGIEGVAVAVTFHQHGCERVSLETVRDNRIEEYGFDAPRLSAAATGERVTTGFTGGSARADISRRGPVRR